MGRGVQSKGNPLEVVLSYIRTLDGQKYDAVTNYLNEGVRIIGPAGEFFGEPREFVDMLRKFQGRYDVKKVFSDGGDVCLLYDLVTPAATVFMCSWYQVKDGKIVSIRTVFDPSAFSPPPDKRATRGGVGRKRSKVTRGKPRKLPTRR